MSKSKIIYKFKEPATSLHDAPKINYDLDDFIMDLEFIDANDKKTKYKLHFKNVYGYQYSSEILRTEYYIDAYNKIIEITDSNWLKPLNEQDLSHLNLENEDLHHYMIYFDGNGIYSFIAKSFEVEEIK